MIEVKIIDTTMYMISDMEISFILVSGILIGVVITGFFAYIGYLQNKRKQYMKTLNDKDFRKYVEKVTDE